VEGLVAVRLPSKPAGYETSQAVSEFQQRLLQRLESSPAIAAVASASNLPLERGVNTRMSIRGRAEVVGTVEWRAVTPGYFDTLGVTLLTGRAFADSDVANRPGVAIVNESFARRYLSDESHPLGRGIEVGRLRREAIDSSPAGAIVEIVGVAADLREISLRAEPRPTIYVPQAQAPDFLSNVRGTMPVFVARRGVAGGDVERVLAEALRAVDPGLARPQIFPLEDVVARSLARERFGATLLTAVAVLALALTAFGIYGILAYAVQQRRREIGIRMALGATGGQVGRLVIAQGIVPVLAGLVLGVAGSLSLSGLLAGYLWGIAPTDPGMLAVVAAVLLGVAFVATASPARDAARMDPVETLNSE
jgi:predicted permease